MTKKEEQELKRQRKLQAELERLEGMLVYEREYRPLGVVCGIDEVGRGPLAGPVVAGAVILPEDCQILYLNDSKKLTERRRELLYEEIMEKAVAVGLGVVSQERIDEINILQATYEAMREAVGKLDPQPEILLNDAVTIPGLSQRQIPIIKGDAKSQSIAAASVVAKVTRDHMMIAGVVLAVIIVIIMLLLFSKVLGIGKKSNTDTSDSQQTEQSADEEDDSSSASQGNTVNMPSLLGKTYAEARTVLEELGLKIERGESEKSNQYSAGQIIAQSEESGNSVKVGTTVTVTLAAAGSTASSDGTSSTGSTTSGTTTTTTNSKVTVPSVVGKDENAAKSAITAAGLTVGTVSEASSDTVESGLVISQSPSANSETESNGKVNIVLSSGPNKKKVTDVIGHESSRAQSELAGDGFKVEVKETYSNDMRAGLVVSTSPDRGTYVQPGSTVTITVSKGREQVTIPSVSVGMTYEEAVEALNDAGFKGTVKEATEYSASVGNGFVTRYSPSKTVDPDGTVTIYVSLGTQSTTE